MLKRFLVFSVAPLAALLSAAGPAPDPLDDVRQGNAAFARQEYDAAEELYQHAGERIADPGLAAFNRAAALYRKQMAQPPEARRFGQVEVLYRQSLADAEGRRRLLALFGLANCLVHQSKELGADALTEAIGHYRACLGHEGLEPETADDIRHNLELAKLLLLEAKPSRPERPRNPDAPQENPENPNPSRGRERDDRGTQGAGTDASGKPFEQAKAEPQPGEQPVPLDQQPSPGAGNKPPVSDKGEYLPLAPDAAAARLRQAREMVLQEGREHDRGPKEAAGVLDR